MTKVYKLNEWIDINLPWYKHIKVIHIDTKRDERIALENKLVSKVEKEVGYTKKELKADYAEYYGMKVETQIELLDNIEKEFPILKGLGTEDSSLYFKYSKEWKNKALKEVGNNKYAAYLIKTRYLRGKIDRALFENKELTALYDFWKEENEIKKEVVCFKSHSLCKSGVLVEVQTKEGIKKWLIGDMNELGGVCDDCKDIKDEDIVLRAKIVYDKEIG